MKRYSSLFPFLLGFFVLLSCQKTQAPELAITGSANIESLADGSSSSITFTSNRDWSASSSESWIHVSPSSGTASEGPITVSIRCDANNTYEDRSGTVIIRAENLSQTILVKQPANLGIVLPTQVFDLQSDSRTIEVEVKANVEYSVDISADWIKQTGTKALTSKILVFCVEENTSYDAREGRITIKPQNDKIQEQVISVKQAQKDAIHVKKTSYEIPYGGGEVEIKVESNVSFDVKPNVDWIHYTQTKALSSSTVCLKIDENITYDAREGNVEVVQQNGSIRHIITFKQAGQVPVSSITLDNTKLELVVGESALLHATVLPNNASDKTITWSSSDSTIASVEDGLVTAIRDGSVTIFAKSGNQEASCTVIIAIVPLQTPLCLEAIEDAIIQIANPLKLTIEFSKDGLLWESSNSTPITVNLLSGERAFLRGDNKSYSNGSYHTRINCSGKCYVFGNIMSLLSSKEFSNKNILEEKHTFRSLFFNNNNIYSHPEYDLVLPATSLSSFCYELMFRNCSNLTKAPDLPAAKVEQQSYYQMFYGCSSLMIAPKISGTDFGYSSCLSMFEGCSSLEEFGELNADNIYINCFWWMFKDCVSLKKGPSILPATQLYEKCYYAMFENCHSLLNVPELPATELAEGCYHDMFQGCRSITSAPELPALILNDNCYNNMFCGCINLNYIKMMAIDISANHCLYHWTSIIDQSSMPVPSGVASSGTFVKNKRAEWDVIGTSGVPEGWDIQLSE